MGLPPRADEIGKKGKTMLTQEQKQAIFAEYSNRENKVADIADKYGITRGEATRGAVEMGAEPRRTNYGTRWTKKKAARVCPKCRKTIDVKGAKFCCYCGSDIRSNKELLIERAEKAFRNVQLLPANARDEMQTLLLDIIAELKK